MKRFRAFALLLAFAASPRAQTALSPDEALATLRAGNQRFAADSPAPHPRGEGMRRTLARGQSPYAIVVCCSDSRVPPEHVFDAGLGELFVVRIAGNVCDPEALASVEYAAEHLGAPVCVVLGHSGCGAVAATSAGEPESPALAALCERIAPACARARSEGLHGDALRERCETENAYETAAECLRRSATLRELVRLRRLAVHAAHYDLASGVVEWLPPRPVEMPQTMHTEPHVAVAGMPPHLALAMLQAGHRRFLRGADTTVDIGAARRGKLAEGQRPLAIVLTCSDSRVAPEHVFDAGLGELFVVRIAGNVLTDTALASVEYALAHTGATLVVVMGHQRCGAVAAAVAHAHDPQLSPSMRELVRRLSPAVDAARSTGQGGEELLASAVAHNVVGALGEARARSAIVRELEQQGRVALVPVVYELDSGDLHWLNEAALAAIPATPGGAAHSDAHRDDRGDDAHASTRSGSADRHGEHVSHAATAPADRSGEREHHAEHGGIPAEAEPDLAHSHAEAVAPGHAAEPQPPATAAPAATTPQTQQTPWLILLVAGVAATAGVVAMALLLPRRTSSHAV